MKTIPANIVQAIAMMVQPYGGMDALRAALAPAEPAAAAEPKSPRKLWYSKREAAQLLGVHPKTLERLAQAGRLQVRRLGGRVLVPAAIVEQGSVTTGRG